MCRCRINIFFKNYLFFSFTVIAIFPLYLNLRACIIVYKKQKGVLMISLLEKNFWPDFDCYFYFNFDAFQILKNKRSDEANLSVYILIKMLR